jgi:hypothetical protein
MDRLTPVRAIRAKCLECQGGSRKAVRDCIADFPLRPYRMGRNPNRVGIGRAMSSEDAHSARKRTSQVVTSGEKKTAPQGSTPETLMGHPRAKVGQVDLVAMPAPKGWKIIRAAEAFMRELREAERLRGKLEEEKGPYPAMGTNFVCCWLTDWVALECAFSNLMCQGR